MRIANLRNENNLKVKNGVSFGWYQIQNQQAITSLNVAFRKLYMAAVWYMLARSNPSPTINFIHLSFCLILVMQFIKSIILAPKEAAMQFPPTKTSRHQFLACIAKSMSASSIFPRHTSKLVCPPSFSFTWNRIWQESLHYITSYHFDRFCHKKTKSHSFIGSLVPYIIYFPLIIYIDNGTRKSNLLRLPSKQKP